MVSLPLFAEPTVARLEPDHRRRHAEPRSTQPPLVRPVLGRQDARVDEQHDAVAAGTVAGLRRDRSGLSDPRWRDRVAAGGSEVGRWPALRSPDALFRCTLVGVAE